MEIKTEFDLNDEIIIKQELNIDNLKTHKINYIRTESFITGTGTLKTEFEYGFNWGNSNVRWHKENEIVKIKDSLDFINEDLKDKINTNLKTHEKIKEKLFNLIKNNETKD